MEIKEGDIFEVPFIAGEMEVFNESYSDFFSFDHKSVATSMNKILSGGGKYWVLWDDDKFAGLCMGTVGPCFYNHSYLIGNCLIAEVLPEYQKTRWQNKLMAEFETWAKENGASSVAYGGEGVFVRRMKRRGCKLVESKLMKEI